MRWRGAVLWYRIRKNGKEFEGSLETENIGDGKARLAKVRAELEATSWGEKPRRTFNEAAGQFADEHFPNLKPKSARRYSVSISNLLAKFDGTFMHEIGSAKLGEFERARKKAGVTNSTIRRDLACLSVIFTKCEEWEWVSHNPVKPFLRGRQLAGLEEGPARTRYLDHDEEHEILECAPKKARKAIEFAIDTGLRKEEQFSLLRTDVNARVKDVNVREEVAKSLKPRRVPLWERALRIATGMPADLRSPYLFTTYKGERYSEQSPYHYEALQKAVRRANKKRAAKGIPPMEHVEWHDLRRTCGCRLLQDHVFSMEEVSKWLGHSSIKVTEEHYAFLTEGHLRERVEKREAEIVSIRGTNGGT
jgi:integrase